MANELTLPASAAPVIAEYLPNIKLSRENFGIHFLRWPYDPAVRPNGNFTSENPSRWQSELGGSIGWFRAFDPNIFGRYMGGAFAKIGVTSEAIPYGRMEGGKWYKGMLRSDGGYDFTKLDLVLNACAAKNMKVLLSLGSQGAYWDGVKYLEFPLPTGEFASLNWDAYQHGMLNFLGALFDYAGGRIAAVELANEPGRLVRLNTELGPGHTERLAVLCRLAKQQILARSLSTLVLSPPFQGGETREVKAFLTASAAGIAVGGKDGAGTLGRDWIDVLAHHNYGNFSDRGAAGAVAALDAARINDPAADAAYPSNTAFNDMFNKGRNLAAAAKAGGWFGPRWNTECNVTGVVANSRWHPRKMTEAGMKRLLFQTLVSSFASGYEKCFLYAADHPTLGFFDNTGTPPAGEPADWYFKAQNNTARGAAALAQAIAALTRGEVVTGSVGTWADTSAPLLAERRETFGSAFSIGMGSLGWIVHRRNKLGS